MPDRYFDTPQKLNQYLANQEGKVSRPLLAKRVADISGYKLDISKDITDAVLRAIMEIMINCDNTIFPGLFKISTSPTKGHTQKASRTYRTSRGDNPLFEKPAAMSYPRGHQTQLKMSEQLIHLRRLRLDTRPGSIGGRKGLVIAENQSVISRIVMFRYVFEEHFPQYKGKNMALSERRMVIAKHLNKYASLLGRNHVAKVFKSKEDEELYEQFSRENAKRLGIDIHFAPGRIVSGTDSDAEAPQREAVDEMVDDLLSWEDES